MREKSTRPPELSPTISVAAMCALHALRAVLIELRWQEDLCAAGATMGHGRAMAKPSDTAWDVVCRVFVAPLLARTVFVTTADLSSVESIVLRWKAYKDWCSAEVTEDEVSETRYFVVGACGGIQLHPDPPSTTTAVRCRGERIPIRGGGGRRAMHEYVGYRAWPTG